MSISSAKTKYEHVVLNKDGSPIIAGTNMKVIELVLEKNAYGWSPEELHFQHPYLTLGQIYSTLAYYWDHRDELDRDIEKRAAFIKEIQQNSEQTPLVARLKAEGLIRT